MITLQDKPDKSFVMPNGSYVIPIATLKDCYGGKSHIIIDDYCYCLINENKEGKRCETHHWHDEAIEVLKQLPLPSQKQKEIMSEILFVHPLSPK